MDSSSRLPCHGIAPIAPLALDAVARLVDIGWWLVRVGIILARQGQQQDGEEGGEGNDGGEHGRDAIAAEGVRKHDVRLRSDSQTLVRLPASEGGAGGVVGEAVEKTTRVARRLGPKQEGGQRQASRHP